MSTDCTMPSQCEAKVKCSCLPGSRSQKRADHIRKARNLLAGAAVTCVVVAVAAFSANALPLLPAFSIEAGAQVQTDPGTIDTETSTSAGTTSASGSGASGSGQGQVTVSSSPLPSIATSVSVSNDASTPGASHSAATASASLTYSFELVGPRNGPVSVTVNATGGISTSTLALGNSNADAHVLFQISKGSTVVLADAANFGSSMASSTLHPPGQLLSFGTLGVGEISGSASGGFTGGFSETGTHSFLANTPYTVLILVDAVGSILGGQSIFSCPGCLGGSEQISAFVDPMLSVNDPLFTLDLSPGIGNGAGVGDTPLPAALPLFATGLGALGLLGWRRKRKALAPAA